MKTDLTSTNTSNGLVEMPPTASNDVPPDDEFNVVASVPESFSIVDQDSANWIVRKIVECRAYAERVTSWAAAEVRRAEHEEQFFFFRFGRQLEQWTANQIEKHNRRRKSVNLPAGTIGFRAVQPKLVITSEQKLLLWCQRCLPEAIKVTVEAAGSDGEQLVAWLHAHHPNASVTEAVSKSQVNQHFEECGELPDGVDLIKGENRFYVK